MKKYFLIACIVFITSSAFAKKVKFSLDLSGWTPNTTGVHVAGDFQAVAGFPGGDWQPGTTTLVNEEGTEIWSIVLDIPALAKYEYKFLNGDQWYDVEFVPPAARVGYNFNDNRWIYVDSLANDTTMIGPIPFSGTAPAGTFLVRFKVGMQLQPNPDPEGVHVAGSFQGWNPSTTRMYSFDGSIYEYIAYVPQNNPDYEFKFVNGNIPSKYEIVPAQCATNGNRSITVTEDLVLDEVCFSACVPCSLVGFEEKVISDKIRIFPNPTSGQAFIDFNDGNEVHEIVMTDATNRVIKTFDQITGNEFVIRDLNFTPGTYFLIIFSNQKKIATHQFIVR